MNLKAPAAISQQNTVARIVVIDDDALVRDSLCVFLEDLDYQVFPAANGGEGLRCIRTHTPDLVLCDLRMPDQDGLYVLESTTREFPGMPVIVVSGVGMIADVVEALRLGATDYLVKPIVDMAVLEHAVSSALHKAELELENQHYRDELENANLELQKNLEVLKQDHEAGRQAQLQLLPEPDCYFGEFHFTHAIIPSLYLSGDFLDFFEIDKRYIGFYIADVSGHGAASAFVTMMLKSLINHPLRQYRSQQDETIIKPDRLLTYLNHELLQSNLGKYLTLFYGVIDREQHLLSFANGGHYPRPLLVSEGSSDTTHRHFLGEGSFPVGLFDWANYNNETVTLKNPFRLIMASDGVLELLALTGAAKNEELLINFVESMSSSMTEMADALKQRLPGMPPDDIALFQIEGN